MSQTRSDTHLRSTTRSGSFRPLTDDEVAHHQQVLDRGIAADAKSARCLADATAVARRVDTVRRHRPVVLQLLRIENQDGSSSREVGFVADDGAYVGTVEPMIGCGHHERLTDWPCADVQALLDRYEPALALRR
jgi:hypothetical protein